MNKVDVLTIHEDVMLVLDGHIACYEADGNTVMARELRGARAAIAELIDSVRKYKAGMDSPLSDYLYLTALRVQMFEALSRIGGEG